MKKIITAAAIAAMVTSFAAAEVTVGLSTRIRPNIVRVDGYTEKGAADSYTTTTYADLDAESNSDTFSIKGSTDYAGVVAEMDVATKDAASSSNPFKTYYGWVNWGAFKLTGGAFESRYTSRGNYTATEEGILDGGGFGAKYGDDVIGATTGFTKGLGASGDLAVANGIFLKDFGDIGSINNGKNLALIADYTFNDIGGGRLLLKGGLIKTKAANLPDDETTYTYTYVDENKDIQIGTSKDSFAKFAGDDNKDKWTLLATKTDTTVTSVGGTYDTYNNDGENSTKVKFTQEAGYVFSAGWRKDNVIDAEFVFKNPYNKAYGFGIYLTPLMIPNTKNVVLGFTYGTLKDVMKYTYAVDLRGQYNVTDAAVVALGAKYESQKLDKDFADVDAQNALELATEVSYKFNDVFTGALDLGYFNTDVTDYDDNKDDGSQSFVVSARGLFTAGAGATVTASTDFKKILNPADGGLSYIFSVPVVLRVKM